MTLDPVDHAQALIEQLPDDPADLKPEHLPLIEAALEGSYHQAMEVRRRQIVLTKQLLRREPPPRAEEEVRSLDDLKSKLAKADQLLDPYLARAAEVEQEHPNRSDHGGSSQPNTEGD